MPLPARCGTGSPHARVSLRPNLVSRAPAIEPDMASLPAQLVARVARLDCVGLRAARASRREAKERGRGAQSAGRSMGIGTIELA